MVDVHQSHRPTREVGNRLSPGAGKHANLPQGDHFFFWDPISEQVTHSIEEFLTGTPRMSVSNRTLATVLFTDLVDSTGRALRMGDRPWRDLLDKHDRLVRTHLARFGGRELKTTGDGFLAMFDGPSRAAHCAIAIRDEALTLGLAVRAGLHTGEVELRDHDIAGIAVHMPGSSRKRGRTMWWFREPFRI